ncbi:MAG: DUF4345 domain-containing protein [Alphaproteobacteria bacterium]|nr:DUF4345 domain-containing protein [Alphaproteobacteria bacterium]
MFDLINIAMALLSIGLGAVGWLAPRYTMDLLDLSPSGSTMGVSEIRAASGALFIGLGAGALILNEPFAYAMIGFAWGGAAIGRLTSIIADEAPTQRTWWFFGTEAVVALALLAINL